MQILEDVFFAVCCLVVVAYALSAAWRFVGEYVVVRRRESQPKNSWEAMQWKLFGSPREQAVERLGERWLIIKTVLLAILGLFVIGVFFRGLVEVIGKDAFLWVMPVLVITGLFIWLRSAKILG